MNDVLKNLKANLEGDPVAIMSKARVLETIAEIERLQKYERLVQFIANDYYELSHDKIKCLYIEYKKRCQKLIGEEP